MGSGRRRGWIRFGLVILCLEWPAWACAGGAFVSDLQWSADGKQIVFRAGAPEEARTLVLDIATGGVSCPAPQVREPNWSQARGAVLFRDVFGVFEAEVGPRVGPPRQVLFLPAASPLFLRACGSDSQGRILVWTYDRRSARHEIWTLESGNAVATPLESGPEALLAWRRRNQASAFEAVSNRFVRTACLRRPGSDARLCAELVPDGTRTPNYRVTLGPPGGIEILATHCYPTALAAAPDSSRVVLGLLERVQEGRSALASAWLVSWADARRVYELPLEPAVDVRARRGAWVRWLDSQRALWAEGHAGLWKLEAQSGQPLVAAPRTVQHARLACVVVDRVRERADAEAMASALREAGLEAGVLQRAMGYEIQAGASSNRESLQARTARLRQMGFARAVVETCSIEEIAPGVPYGHVPGPAGLLAWAVLVDHDGERLPEIHVQVGEAPPRRVLGDWGSPSLATTR